MKSNKIKNKTPVVASCLSSKHTPTHKIHSMETPILKAVHEHRSLMPHTNKSGSSVNEHMRGSKRSTLTLPTNEITSLALIVLHPYPKPRHLTHHRNAHIIKSLMHQRPPPVRNPEVRYAKSDRASVMKTATADRQKEKTTNIIFPLTSALDIRINCISLVTHKHKGNSSQFFPFCSPLSSPFTRSCCVYLLTHI